MNSGEINIFKSTMTSKVLATLFVILSVANQAIACLNEYRTLLNGQVVYSDAMGGLSHYERLDSMALFEELSELDSLYKIDKSHETLSDYGVILIYLGRLNEAIHLYRKIEREHPNLYATASNMGTAFELLGHIDSAGYYIRKAITIDPDSHNGSEWIHLKILEAKTKLLTNPEYLRSHSILGVDFGNEGKPVGPEQADLGKLENEIRFQLSERMTFVKPPDLIVGQLLFDFGNVCAITIDVQAALECYEMAEEYGYRTALLNKRITTLKPLAFKATLANLVEQKVKDNLVISLIVMAVLGIGAIWLVVKVVKTVMNSLR